MQHQQHHYKATCQISPLLYAERQMYRPPRYKQSPSQSRFRSASNNNSIRKYKRCNVCFKLGRWSTNNSRNERKIAFQRNRKIGQFLAEIDDDDMELDAVSDGLQKMITRIQIPDTFDSYGQSQLNTGNIESDNLFQHPTSTKDDESKSSSLPIQQITVCSIP